MTSVLTLLRVESKAGNFQHAPSWCLFALLCFALLCFALLCFALRALLCQRLDWHLRGCVPALAEHLEDEEVPTSMFFVEWVTTLFVYNLPFETARVVLGLFLVEGALGFVVQVRTAHSPCPIPVLLYFELRFEQHFPRWHGSMMVRHPYLYFCRRCPLAIANANTTGFRVGAGVSENLHRSNLNMCFSLDRVVFCVCIVLLCCTVLLFSSAWRCWPTSSPSSSAAPSTRSCRRSRGS